MLISILLTKALGLVQVHHFPGVVLGPPAVTGGRLHFVAVAPTVHLMPTLLGSRTLSRNTAAGAEAGDSLEKGSACRTDGGRAWQEVSPEASTAEF